MKLFCILFSWLVVISYFIVGHAMLSWILPYTSDFNIYLLLSAPCAFIFGLCVWFVIDENNCKLRADQIGGIDKTKFQEDETQQIKHINYRC